MPEKDRKEIEIKARNENVILIILFLFIILALIRSYYINNFTNEISIKVKEIKEETRPAYISMVKVIDSECKSCFDINQLINFIQSLNVNITSSEILDYSSNKDKESINRLGIKTVPAIVLSGEINKSNVVNMWSRINGKIVDGSVYIEAIPPYRNLSSGEIEGLVKLIMLTDNSCNNCYNVSIHKNILSRFGVFIVNESTYDINSSQGKELISKYNITKVPTILLSPDANVYSLLKQVWLTVGSIEKDGWFVFRAAEIMGVYKDISIGKIIEPQR